MVAYCGIFCSDCGAYIATKKNDDKLRQEQADKWSKQYNHPIKTEDINCDGCTSNSKLINYCSVCEIRKCGMEKGVINCAWCSAYPCAKLDVIFKHAPATRQTLDAIKKVMH